MQIVGRNCRRQLPDRAADSAAKVARIPGAADVHIHQVVDWPEIDVNVDRDKAGQVGLTQRDVGQCLARLAQLERTGRAHPVARLEDRRQLLRRRPDAAIQDGFAWLRCCARPSLRPIGSIGNGVSAAARRRQRPTRLPPAYGNPGSAPASTQLLANMASVARNVAPEIVNHYNVQPVFDVYANIDRRDLGSVGAASRRSCTRPRPSCRAASSIDLRGQITTMQNSFYRLGLGMAFAVVLVYLLMAVNFQSWLDPFIILMALPGALAGIVWMLFLTQTTFSVPSLMGAIMCIGVATANSILLVVFANDQRLEGMDARSAALSAGHTRIRPVIMTATAMIIGMLPMALGLGEGGEQNAPLGRAVIGGLLLATVTTLFVVPMVYSLLRTKPPVNHEHELEKEEEDYLREEMLLRGDLQ